MSIAKKFLEGVDAEHIRLGGVDSLVRWNLLTAEDEPPGTRDLDEVVDEAAAGPVSQNEGGD